MVGRAPLELPGGACRGGSDAVPSSQPLAPAGVCFSFVSIQRTNGTGKGGMELDGWGGRGSWVQLMPGPCKCPIPGTNNPDGSQRDSREKADKTKILKYLAFPLRIFQTCLVSGHRQKSYTPSQALSLLQVGPSVGLGRSGEKQRPTSSAQAPSGKTGGWSTAGISLMSPGCVIRLCPGATARKHHGRSLTSDAGAPRWPHGARGISLNIRLKRLQRVQSRALIGKRESVTQDFLLFLPREGDGSRKVGNQHILSTAF